MSGHEIKAFLTNFTIRFTLTVTNVTTYQCYRFCFTNEFDISTLIFKTAANVESVNIQCGIRYISQRTLYFTENVIIFSVVRISNSRTTVKESILIKAPEKSNRNLVANLFMIKNSQKYKLDLPAEHRSYSKHSNTLCAGMLSRTFSTSWFKILK